jgi:hypothetical protein
VNSFYGLTAIPGSGPDAMQGYRTLEYLSQTAAPFVAGPVGGAIGESLDASVIGISEGTTLFRVFGNEAQGLGGSYTTVNPGSVANFRTAAGLYPGNSGSFVLQGTLNNTEGVIYRSALPGPGGVGGGLPEVVVPNPATQININRVSGVNPPF